MKSIIRGLTSRWRPLLCLPVSMSLGVAFLLSFVDPALSETVSLSCAGNEYVRLVWLNLDRGEVQYAIGTVHSAHAATAGGDSTSDALYNAKNGALSTYPLAVTGDTYKWTMLASGISSPVTINRITGKLQWAGQEEQCSRASIDPPATKF
ncbi:MAG TPA: hypothetical protein VHC39_09935 [Rhizomicrobium sp.]|nr:hypothetical protein [Rhizomicrobium sp.]